MCGIVAYVGKEKSAEFLIKKLKKLEYRGYDSAGFAWLEKNEIKTLKKSGNIQNLLNEIKPENKIETAISHTRWATHGEPNETNAHPHLSINKNWAIVHNGIIENFAKIKEKFNFKTKSETDTEVVAQLLEFSRAKTINDFIDVFSCVEGSFAICALNKQQQNTLFLAKEKSPLYVAENSGDFLVASDPICFNGFSKEYYSLDDGEFAEIKNKNISFFDENKQPKVKAKIKLETIVEDDDKGEYLHFMLKEIMQEKDAIKNQIKTFKERKIFEQFDDWFLAKFKEIKFIGCGTAYHAGLMGAKFIQKILSKKASAEMASEFVYNKPKFLNPKTLYVFVSQSGETADTLRALEIVKNENLETVAITNVLYSSLSKKVKHVIPICAGVEIAVASTKAYVCMLSAIYLFCKFFESKNELKNAYKNLENLSSKILNFNYQKIEQIAEEIFEKPQAMFIGKDMDYITSLESSLKLKEVSYINANAYPAGELKHGFLALVEKGTPVFVFALQKEIKTKTINSAKEAEARGANLIVFSNEKVGDFKNQITIDEDDEFLSQIQIMASMQYLAYVVSIKKNINPDQPRNLAKSVTVEWLNLFLVEVKTSQNPQKCKM